MEGQNVEIKFSAGIDVAGPKLCIVCGDRASRRHYGAICCEGCKSFFKRTIRKKLRYQCRGSMTCEVTKHLRNSCQYCRLQKCLACGMQSDSLSAAASGAGGSSYGSGAGASGAAAAAGAGGGEYGPGGYGQVSSSAAANSSGYGQVVGVRAWLPGRDRYSQ